MAGIALLMPEEEMCNQARHLIQRKENHVVCIQQTRIDTVVAEARRAVAMGANIVVARGSQAYEVKLNTKVPVVEIGLTARELGLAIVKAKEILKKPNPRIGIFFWRGMLCDTTDFDKLFDVRIIRRDLDRERSWAGLVDEAASEGMDFLISGETCVSYARQRGIPAMQFHTTKEAIAIGLQSAEKLYEMSRIEQQSYAQFVSVLDSAFHGIMKTDQDGRLLLMNRVMEQMLDLRSEQVLGLHIGKVLDGLDQEVLGRVLAGKMDSYSTFINTRGQAFVVVIEPIAVDGMITGLIVSCNKLKRMDYSNGGGDNTREQFLKGFVAKGSLDELAARLPDLKEVTELAKLYAPSSSPILVEGKTDQELEELCQGIHNYSLRKNGPFVVINMAAFEEREQAKVLFGDKEGPGALVQANYGTLVIRAVDKLTLNAQLGLLRAIRRRRLSVTSIDNDYIQELDVRLIGCTSKSLGAARRDGRFRSDLYYLFQTFRLTVPDFSQRRGDVRVLAEQYIRKYMSLYTRYHILTEEAKKAIGEYWWEGNDMQLEAFCERLVLTAPRRQINEAYVRSLLDQLYYQEEESGERKKEEKEMAEPQRLKETLEKYNGSRTLAAKALNISTSTLWRRMKRWGIK